MVPALFIWLFVAAIGISQQSFASSKFECPQFYMGSGQSNSHGYVSEIQALDPNAPHTITNMEVRLTSDLGEIGYRYAKDGNVNFVIIEGPLQKALKKAEQLGYKNLKAIPKVRRVIELFEARDLDGKRVVLVTRVNGKDSLIHAQSVLRLSGVAAARVKTVGGFEPLDTYYKRAFEKIGYVPDGLVFGWPNSLVNSIFFQNKVLNAGRYLSLLKAYREKHTEPTLTDHELEGLGVQVLEFKNGKKIWFVNYARGDRSLDIFNAAVEYGIKDITLIGTAGSLSGDDRVGQIVTPRFQRDENGAIHDLAGLVEALPSSPAMGVYQRVSTPNIETEAWLSEMKKSDVRYIDVEMGYLLDVKRKHPEVTVRPLFVVSDILDPNHRSDITKWSAKKARQVAPNLLELFRSKFDFASSSDYQLNSYQNIPLYDVQLNKEVIADDVEIVWYPKPYIGGHTSLGENENFWNLRGNRLKTTMTTVRKKIANEIDTREFYRFKLNVSQEEADKVRELIGKRVGTKAGKLETCTAAVCSVVSEATGFKIPFPFNKLPHLNALYLFLLEKGGYSRIATIEYINPKDSALKSRMQSELTVEMGYIRVKGQKQSGDADNSAEIVPIKTFKDDPTGDNL